MDDDGYEQPPGVDLRAFVFGDGDGPCAPLREPMPEPVVVPPAPSTTKPIALPQLVVGDYALRATPVGKTDGRHDHDPNMRDREERRAADEAAAKAAGVTSPPMSLFDGLF